MTPDQIFARWVRASLLLFALVFVYFLAADLWMPLTPQSRVMHPVVRVAPQVSGQVVSVPVADNQHVQAGEVLFRIDPRPYELAVQQAQLALEAAERDNAGYDASLAAAEADVIADFREKSLVHMQRGEAAAVVFDALPGKVFAAHVTAVDAGTQQGQLLPDGTLAAPETSDRWVRDAQRQRIHLQLEEPALLSELPSGARATVQLYPDRKSVV